MTSRRSASETCIADCFAWEAERNAANAANAPPIADMTAAPAETMSAVFGSGGIGHDARPKKTKLRGRRPNVREKRRPVSAGPLERVVRHEQEPRSSLRPQIHTG